MLLIIFMYNVINMFFL